MLHHGRDGEGNDGDAGGDEHAGIEVTGEQAEYGGFLVNGDADPCSLADLLRNDCAGGGVDDHGDNVGGEDAYEDGDDLYHALAPHIAGDDHDYRDDRDEPVGFAVIDSGGGEDQADGDDDGAGDDRGEEAHDFLHADALDYRRKDNIHKAGDRDAEAGVGQQLGFAVGSDCPVTGEVSEGGAEERGNFAPGDKVEQQRAETGKQQRGGNVKPGQCGDEHGRAEHGEHVLEAEDEHARSAKLARIKNGTVNGFLVFHSIYLSL